MTQQQIDTMTGILEGREFTWNGLKYRFLEGVLQVAEPSGWSGISVSAGPMIGAFKQGRITLVPQPPEPLSDEIGEALWMHCLTTWGDRSPDRTGKLLEAKLILPFTLTPTQKGKYLLGEYLMRVNKEAV